MSTWSTGVVPPGQECIQNWQLQLQRVLPVFEVYCTRRVQYSIVDVPTVLYLVWYLTKTRTKDRTHFSNRPGNLFRRHFRFTHQ